MVKNFNYGVYLLIHLIQRNFFLAHYFRTQSNFVNRHLLGLRV